jgi:hypothetical protein
VTPKPARKYNQAKVERDPYDQAAKPMVEAAKPRNWIDFFRAGIGAFTLLYVMEQKAGDFETAPKFLFWAGGAMFVAVLLQMIRYQKKLSFYAPTFFLQGLTFGLAGGVIGMIAMVGSWALSPILPTAGALLFVQGAVTLCLSLLVSGADPVLGMVAAGLVWTPVLISVLLGKRLAASFDKKLKIMARDTAAE